jgi:hypothetical protein
LLITSFKSTTTNNRQGFIFGLAASLLVSAGIFLTLIQPGTIDTDGGIFSAIAFKDLHGGLLYNTAWENKPPGIFFLIELFYILIPSPVYALFIMAFLAFLLFAAVLFSLFFKYLESMVLAVLCTGIAMYFTIYSNNIGDGLYTEIYGTLCLVLSLAFFELYIEKQKKSYFALSAVFSGFSFWFKEPFILICIPLAAFYISQLKTRKEVWIMLLYFTIPSILFFILLTIKHSTVAFFDAFLYNFQYSANQESNDLNTKLGDYYKNLIHPLLGLSVLLALMLYGNLSDKKTRLTSLLFLLIFISSTLFVFLAPYNLGHYYFPSFVLFFILLCKQYRIFKIRGNSIYLPFLLLLIYSIYKIDDYPGVKFTYRIQAFEPDRITQRLRQDKDATLFVDYVNVGSYYIKSGKVHPAFLPVALPVHFDHSENGKKNSARIWKELSSQPPDYLITTFTTSYFSWSLPETDFYARNYMKIDSVYPKNENVIYLWKYKKH